MCSSVLCISYKLVVRYTGFIKLIAFFFFFFGKSISLLVCSLGGIECLDFSFFFDGITDACHSLSPSLNFYYYFFTTFKIASNKEQNVFCSTLLPGSVAVNMINIPGREPKFC